MSFFFFDKKEQCFVSLIKWRRFNARAKVDDLRAALKSIGRSDIIKKIDMNVSRDQEAKNKEMKKSSLQEVDVKKREIEALHQKLVKYLDKVKNGEETNQFDFKFLTKQDN